MPQVEGMPQRRTQKNTARTASESLKPSAVSASPAPPELRGRVAVDDVPIHVAALRSGVHQSLVNDCRNTLVFIGLAAGEQHTHGFLSGVITHRQDHAGINIGHVHVSQYTTHVTTQHDEHGKKLTSIFSRTEIVC